MPPAMAGGIGEADWRVEDGCDGDPRLLRAATGMARPTKQGAANGLVKRNGRGGHSATFLASHPDQVSYFLAASTRSAFAHWVFVASHGLVSSQAHSRSPETELSRNSVVSANMTSLFSSDFPFALPDANTLTPPTLAASCASFLVIVSLALVSERPLIMASALFLWL